MKLRYLTFALAASLVVTTFAAEPPKTPPDLTPFNEQGARGEFPKGELNNRRVGAVEAAIKAIEAATTQPEIRNIPTPTNGAAKRQEGVPELGWRGKFNRR